MDSAAVLSGLQALEAIRDLVARYNAWGDAGRVAELCDLFASDALLVAGETRCSGRAEIRHFFESVIADTSVPKPRLLRHFVSGHCIDLGASGTAHGRCYFQVLTEAGLDHWGRYLDRYAEVEGRWRLQEREVRVEGVTPGGWACRRGYRGS